MSRNAGASSPERKPVGISAHIILIVIRGYQLTLSAFLGRQCRFGPSCSDYAAEAVRLHGAWRGGWLGLKRIGRCHPWGGSGYDPVPMQTRPGAGCDGVHHKKHSG